VEKERTAVVDEFLDMKKVIHTKVHTALSQTSSLIHPYSSL